MLPVKQSKEVTLNKYYSVRVSSYAESVTLGPRAQKNTLRGVAERDCAH